MVMVTLGVIGHGFTSESSISRQAADSTPASEIALVTCGIESVVTTRAAPAARMSAWALSRSEEHTSELQSLMRISYAVFCLKKKKIKTIHNLEHITNVNNQHTYIRNTNN